MNATTSELRRTDPLDLVSTVHAPVVADPADPGIRRSADILLRRLQQAKAAEIVPVVFGNRRLSASCIAAILAPAIRGIVRGDFPERYVVGVDPDAANEWEADAALRKQSEQWSEKLVCVWKTSERTSLVGAVDPQIRATYEFGLRGTIRADGATARALAEREGITIQAASNRFAKAAMLGLLHPAGREAVPGGGSQKLYVPVS